MNLEGSEVEQQQEGVVSSPTKEAWIIHSLNKRRNEFLDSSTINIFVGTWNVNGRAPPDPETLSKWILPTNNNNPQQFQHPEILVLGFQELDTRAEAFVYNDTVKDGAWTAAIEQCLLNHKTTYKKTASKQLIGMFIMVYARQDVVQHVAGIQDASVGCGIMGMVGNKGAVAVRFKYKDTPICLVCSHLAHDAAQVDRRNAQFHDICKRLQFAEDVGGIESASADPLVPPSLAPKHNLPLQLTIFDHSYVVWLGDLNYRLAINPDNMHNTPEYRSLIGLDQLKMAIMNRQAFTGFEEADIDFKPTYKYILGTSDYDPARVSSWCDRVLWWIRPGSNTNGIKSTKYEAVEDISSSDHKPVYSQLAVSVWRVDPVQRHQAHLEVLRELDHYENECIPTATLKPAIVDFGQVSFGRAASQTMRLANTGQVPLEFSFISTPSRTSFSPSWLQISPDQGMLLPGDAIDLTFTMLVDSGSSAALNTRAEELNDILVLHLFRGRDYFIQVQGNYQVSVYGMALNMLVHCSKAVRGMTADDFVQCLQSGQFSVPKCIWALTDFLSKYAIDKGYSLFYCTRETNQDLEWQIKDCLDWDKPLDPETILQGVEDSRRQQGGNDDEVECATMTGKTLVSSTISSRIRHGIPVDEALEGLSVNGDNSSGEDDVVYIPYLPTASSSIDGSPLPESISATAPHDAGADAVADCLIGLLKSLPEPAIPFEFYQGCIEAGGISRAAALEALQDLPIENLNVLIYLLAFLREAIEKGSTAPRKVARIFAPALLGSELGVDRERAETFVLYLLRTHGNV